MTDAFRKDVTCGTSIANVIDSILYAVQLVGEDHVALGSDWDGAVCRKYLFPRTQAQFLFIE